MLENCAGIGKTVGLKGNIDWDEEIRKREYLVGLKEEESV
jgi:hypothetical protein